MASVKVAVRVRPFNQRERDMNAKLIVQMEGKKTRLLTVKNSKEQNDGSREKFKDFTFDHSYWSFDSSDAQYAAQDQTTWLFATLVTATTNIDCRGKAFHCVNSTHFKICVDFGGVSKTVDDFLIPCPQNTVCTDSNYFECEYEIKTAPVTTERSDVTNQPFPRTTPTFWDNINVTTTNNEEKRIDLSRSSTTSPSQLVFVLPATEQLQRITHTPANNFHEDIIQANEDMLYNTTFNKTRESENNLRPSTTINNGTPIPQTELANIRLIDDIIIETFANTERIEAMRTNSFKSIETATSASTTYNERLVSEFNVNIPLNSMQTYANERNNTPSTLTIGNPSTNFALLDTQSDISDFSGSTDSYIEKISQNMKTEEFNIPITSTENEIAQNLLVNNKNIVDNNDNRIMSLALSENLISTTERNIGTLYSFTTINKPSSYAENGISIVNKNNLSLPVITETSSTTKVDGENGLHISHLTTSTDSNKEYMQNDTKFEEFNPPNMSTANEFYTKAPKIASNDIIDVENNVNKMNETLSAELNETSTLPSEPYDDNIHSTTTENTLFRNIEKDLRILKNTSIPVSVNTVFIKDIARETLSSITSSTNLVHSHTNIAHQDTKLEDKYLPVKLTSDVYEFYTKKDVLNKNEQDITIFEKRTRKNTIDQTTSSTLSENLISMLEKNKNEKPYSIAVNISVTKMPNEAATFKNNNLSSSVIPEYFTTSNIVKDAISDSYTENTTNQMKVRYANFPPITHAYDLFINDIETTPYNVTKDLSFNKNATHSIFSNTTSVDFTTPIIYETKLLVTNAINEDTNTVNLLSAHKHIDLSSAMKNNYRTKDQLKAENILMDTLSYSSTEPYVSSMNQNPNRDYTINVHDSLNTTDSETSLSTTANFLDNKATESPINSLDPSIINGADIVYVKQNKNNYDSLTQKSDNNIIFTKPLIYRTSTNFDNVLQKNEKDSKFITNIFDILSSTTPTADYTQSTEYRIFPTQNTVNNTVLDLLTRKYPLKSNVSNKLESQRTTNNTFLDSVNSSDSLITEIEASTSIIEIDTSETVTVGSLPTRTTQTASKSLLHLLMPVLNIIPDANDIDTVLKTARINSTTSAKKPAISFGDRTNENDSSDISPKPVSETNKLLKIQPKNLFSYSNSNVSQAEVKESTSQSTIPVNSFHLPLATEKTSDKLIDKIKHLVTKSDSSHSAAKTSIFTTEKTTSQFTYQFFETDSNLSEPVTTEINEGYFQSLVKNKTLTIEHKYAAKVNIVAPSDIASTKLAMSNRNETNSALAYNTSIPFNTNVSQSDIKVTELKKPSKELITNSIQHADNSDIEVIKNTDNNVTLESYIAKTLPNKGSSNESQTVTENTELLNMNAQINISNIFGKLTNYTATESTNINSDDFKNMSINIFKHQDSLAVSSNDDINKTSQENNLLLNINKLDYNQDKDSLTSITQVENYSSFAITTSSQKITENKERLNKLKSLEIVNEREENNCSKINNETIFSETYVNPVNDSKSNMMSISEVNNTNNVKIKCKDNNTIEGCSEKNTDFTRLSPTYNNVTNTFGKSIPLVTNCDNHRLGKYSDKNDCKIFYLCLGKGQPIFGKCPNNTVFSEILKQCTKNLSHCVRDNTFQCKSEGRYIDIYSNKFYYICVKKGHKYIRFKLQCQKGYHLSNSKVKCVLDAQNESSSYEDSSYIEKNRKTIVSEPKEDINSKNKINTFECFDEGKFMYPDHCRKYYECKKVKSEFRRKIKKCDSNEVFDDDKKKCVNDDSYECI